MLTIWGLFEYVSKNQKNTENVVKWLREVLI